MLSWCQRRSSRRCSCTQGHGLLADQKLDKAESMKEIPAVKLQAQLVGLENVQLSLKLDSVSFHPGFSFIHFLVGQQADMR